LKQALHALAFGVVGLMSKHFHGLHETIALNFRLLSMQFKRSLQLLRGSHFGHFRQGS
jgi:hypothetical protein